MKHFDKVKVKLGFSLSIKLYKKGQLVERTHTHTCISTETRYRQRESQIEDLAEKTEELTDRVTELPGSKKTAQEAAAEETVLPYEIQYS